MKYRLAALLALVLIFAMGVIAHAAQIPTEPHALSVMTTQKVH
jgi:hypothetical protein